MEHILANYGESSAGDDEDLEGRPQPVRDPSFSQMHREYVEWERDADLERERRMEEGRYEGPPRDDEEERENAGECYFLHCRQANNAFCSPARLARLLPNLSQPPPSVLSRRAEAAHAADDARGGGGGNGGCYYGDEGNCPQRGQQGSIRARCIGFVGAKMLMEAAAKWKVGEALPTVPLRHALCSSASPPEARFFHPCCVGCPHASARAITPFSKCAPHSPLILMLGALMHFVFVLRADLHVYNAYFAQESEG